MEVSGPSPVTARIYDPHGRLVRQLLDLPLAACEHAIRWDGQDVSPLWGTFTETLTRHTETYPDLAPLTVWIQDMHAVWEQERDNSRFQVPPDDVLVLSAQHRQEEKLEDIKRELPVVPESVALPVLLEQFLKNRQHIAIVVNEHGGTDGLVTLEDLIETLMGMEIVDETDSTEDMRALARRRWLKRAKTIGMDLEALEDHHVVHAPENR